MNVDRDSLWAPHPTAVSETFGSATMPEYSPAGYALGVGDQLEIWTITAQVNAGLNAHVYRARDVEALGGRDVALKVLLTRSAYGRQDQVVHEVTAMSSLSLGHPHLMSSTLARRITGGPYAGGVLIVMPWAELNLREYVQALRHGHRLPDGGRWARPTAMCEALAGIADGLAHLHDMQTAHGDVKPDNIMLVDGVWKLGDFGLTRPMEGSYVLSVPGTVSYTAPEEARSHADGTAEIKRRPAGDVWALGVTLHFAVTGGRFPMPGINPDERLAAVRHGDVRVSPDIAPPQLRDLLARGLLADDRERGAASFERRITAAQAGEALRRIAAMDTPPTHRVRLDVPETDALLRYRGQCDRVSAQTVELWRDLGPWDPARAATTARSRGVLATMLTNRLAGLTPPPELRPRKSVLARALHLRAPYETCRLAAHQAALVRYAAPREHSTPMITRLLLLLVAGVLAVPVASLGLRANGTNVVFAACAVVAAAGVIAGVALRGSYPEPAYVRLTRRGPVSAVVGGLVAAVGTVLALAPSVVTVVPSSGPQALLGALIMTVPTVSTALLGGYVGGAVATRRALAAHRRAAEIGVT